MKIRVNTVEAASHMVEHTAVAAFLFHDFVAFLVFRSIENICDFFRSGHRYPRRSSVRLSVRQPSQTLIARIDVSVEVHVGQHCVGAELRQSLNSVDYRTVLYCDNIGESFGNLQENPDH